ncbi:hypothetical protein [Mycobacterium sp. D16Q16]|uniref:hypothetical protein n=1 Tax=Mycobacterium sp. D16Q16 TaxID=1855659 RepID=UPI000991CD6B|nr:hypothetical protein [Mycobacterium sp. D16Q16]
MQMLPSQGTIDPSPFGLGTITIVVVVVFPPGSVTTEVVVLFGVDWPGELEPCGALVVDGDTDGAGLLAGCEQPGIVVTAAAVSATTNRH